MAFDVGLADRVRDIIRNESGLDEKKMFGGLAFLINGNMACGIHTENLIVRLHKDDYEAALTEPGAAVFDLTGKPMKGWMLVASSALDDDADLERWVGRGVEFAQSLPPK